MSDEIRPALTREEWAHARNTKAEIDTLAFQLGCVQPDDFGAMAIANDRLPADDERKITREVVERMRRIATRCSAGEEAFLRKAIATLAALLPPEGA